MKLKSLNKRICTILIVLIVGIASNLSTRFLFNQSFEVFGVIALLTYFGILIGFSLTIYTFGLSMLSDIRAKIEEDNLFDEEKKKGFYENITNGFFEIREDIWIIFISLVLVIIIGVLREIPCPFDWDIEKFKIPDSVNLTLFILSTIAIFDIIKSLFTLSKIYLILITTKSTDSDKPKS